LRIGLRLPACDRADRIAAAAACAEAAGLGRAGVTTLITTPLAGDTAGTVPYEFIDSFSAAGLTS